MWRLLLEGREGSGEGLKDGDERARPDQPARSVCRVENPKLGMGKEQDFHKSKDGINGTSSAVLVLSR